MRATPPRVRAAQVRPVLDAAEQSDVLALPPAKRSEALSRLKPSLTLGVDRLQHLVLVGLAAAATGDEEGSFDARVSGAARFSSRVKRVSSNGRLKGARVRPRSTQERRLSPNNRWIRALHVADDLLPPHDEQLVAYRIAAAKAALAAGDDHCAAVLARAAKRAHAVAFAPGTRLFALRYAPDVSLETTVRGAFKEDDLWRLLT